MRTSYWLHAKSRYAVRNAVTAMVFLICGAAIHAASVRGVVSDASGTKVTGASVSLFSNGKVIATSVSASDGSFQLTSGTAGRFFLVVNAKSFRQLQTPDFYAGALDSIERNLVLEPAWARESIVVTATGTPTPQPQTSAATDVLSPLDLALRTDLVSALRLMPGTQSVQIGQLGARTSFYVRGGDSDDNKVLFDGIDAGDLGNQFNFGPFSATALESVEVYRGPDTTLFGAGAMASVVSVTTPHGTTSFPSLLFEGDAGSLSTSREQFQVAGAHKKLDYLGAYSWLQTANDLPSDKYHVGTAAGNLGWALNGTTQIRGTAHYGVSGNGVPNAWDFYQVADNATQKDQDIYFSGSIDNQTTASFHNDVRYGMARKREQHYQWSPEGTCIPLGQCGGPNIPPTYSGANYYGNPVTITGANGYKASGRALLDYSWDDGATYPYEFYLADNRDQLIYRGDVTITPHLSGLIGFQFEDERGLNDVPSFAENESIERSNYDYQATIHGDFKERFFYSLGGNIEHYSLFGVQGLPSAGFSVYALRPRVGIFSGTRILFDYGDAVREPTLSQQFGSLYKFLTPAEAAQLHVGPLAAPAVRTYEGGAEQSFLSQHVVLRASYFHNQFGKEVESVGGHVLVNLVPGLTAAELGHYYTYDEGLYVNTEAFRAQGIETNVESGIGRNLFLRGGYTYLDAVVQRSFDSDNEALANGTEPTYNGIPIGAQTPLVGARPFHRAPHTGYFTATYAAKHFTAVFSSAFASRSDDSTFLEHDDINGGNSLLLPNRNLDYGYAKLDLGGSYQLRSWVDIYAQAENLLDNQHIAPIGYPGLPFTVRTGLRLRWGPGSGH
jgi:vitamin B12 transporter